MVQSNDLKELLRGRDADLKAEIRRLIMAYRDMLVADNAVATGNLIKSLESPKSVLWELEGNVFYIYFRLPYYWKYAPEELAKYRITKPSKKMVEAISDWIEVKKLPVPTTKKGVPKLNSMAYGIAKGIIKKGWRYQPRKNLERALNQPVYDEVWGRITDIVMEEVDKLINNEINNTFESI